MPWKSQWIHVVDPNSLGLEALFGLVLVWFKIKIVRMINFWLPSDSYFYFVIL